jgi:hypothetical protein
VFLEPNANNDGNRPRPAYSSTRRRVYSHASDDMESLDRDIRYSKLLQCCGLTKNDPTLPLDFL